MIVVDWIGHDDGSTSFEIRKPQGCTDEDGVVWDIIIKDWETLK